MAELLVKYAENFLLLAETIKRRLDKVVEWFGVICYRKWLTTLVAWVLEEWPFAFASRIFIMTHYVEILQPTWLWGTHLEGNTNVHLLSQPCGLWLCSLLARIQQFSWVNEIQFQATHMGGKRFKHLWRTGCNGSVSVLFTLWCPHNASQPFSLSSPFLLVVFDPKIWNACNWRSAGFPIESFHAGEGGRGRLPHFGSIQAIWWSKVEPVLHTVTVSLGRLTLGFHSKTNQDCGFQGNKSASLLFKRILLSVRGKIWRRTCHLRVSSHLSLMSPPKLAWVCGIHATASHLPRCPSHFPVRVCGFN